MPFARARRFGASIGRPSFEAGRIRLFEEYQRSSDRAESASESAAAISVAAVLGPADGGARPPRPVSVRAGVTTSLDVAAQLKLPAKDVARLVVARLRVADGRGGEASRLADLGAPLPPGTRTVELLRFEDDEAARDVFWHSSAHVLGAVVESLCAQGALAAPPAGALASAESQEGAGGDALLCDGPPARGGGFFYEFSAPRGTAPLTPDEFPRLEAEFRRFVASGAPFEKVEVSREQARRMFAYSRFKLDMLDNIPDGEPVSLYRCGPFVDLCRGPHLPSVEAIRAIALERVAGSQWRSDAPEDRLQRVYATSFPSDALLVEHREARRLAAERDHRLIGSRQGLVMFHPFSPGNAFFLPHGTRIMQALMDMIREEYWRRGYEEVVTPQVFNQDLWRISGHLENYSSDMFRVTGHGHGADPKEHPEMGLKPMNCPGHCLIFKNEARSYRDLPLRLADFGMLHRNEVSGALTGLTRVRRFQQDDAHIFCTLDQLDAEIADCLDFISTVYGRLGFAPSGLVWNLSTRPERFLGSVDIWDRAEDILRRALDGVGAQWRLNAGDGAFYGPKIDVQITDALGRLHQCGTVQLDFQLPERFELEYSGPGCQPGDTGQLVRPVMIHRAVLGSLERMLAILMEHNNGRWPFWLNPRQVYVTPVDARQYAYAAEVHRRLRALHVFADLPHEDRVRNSMLSKRVRDAQMQQYNLSAILGAQEEEARTVTLRPREGGANVTVALHQLGDVVAAVRAGRPLAEAAAAAAADGAAN